MVAAEAYRIKLTVQELEGAMFEFTPRERRGTAEFLMDAFRLSVVEAKLWIEDPESGCSHRVSLSTLKKGEVKYERVDGEGKVACQLTDGKADKAIREILIKAGGLIFIED
ncbi:MAG: hypothetical protein G01um10145_745 [Microgenomates group bacterium Gr01-1014_5]|nr:MAG: hypothetical protein G01um10145_745 [Microgenomates group bacterium Gr01-1014_5]